MNHATETTASTAPLMPMFYKHPVPVEPARHAKAGLRPRADVGFASETNAIALTAAEIPHAARCYPIVFVRGAPTVPVAVVGLRDKQNLFVDASGQWREHCYVPAYVRRYPFILSEVPNSQQLVLCVDEHASNFESESPTPFFVDGKPGDALQRSFKFTETYQAHYHDTRLFGEWLDQNDMLEGKVARAELGNGHTLTLQGFRLLNPQRLRELDDAQVLDLHKRGWLPLLHFHLQSLQNWTVLSALAQTR